MISQSFPGNTTEDQEVFTMSNDNNELKNNAPCEDRQEARQLSEEELEQVTGGFFVGPTAVKLPGSSNSWV